MIIVSAYRTRVTFGYVRRNGVHSIWAEDAQSLAQAMLRGCWYCSEREFPKGLNEEDRAALVAVAEAPELEQVSADNAARLPSTLRLRNEVYHLQIREDVVS